MIESRTVEANGLAQHYLTAGSGPAVLLCHGFPELSWSWRHQIPALAAAGFRAIAPDLRGYGGTVGPADPGAYTNLHVIGDLIALLDALGERQAVIVGHDWGSPVAWSAATLRPDRFRAVASLSIMQGPRMALPPTAFARAQGLDRLYWLYFQPPGQAEADMERDPHETFLRLMYGVSAEAAARGEAWDLNVGPGGLLAALKRPAARPAFLTEEELRRYADAYARTGFTQSLNWYRNMDRSWELSAAWADLKVPVPALFLGGNDDPTLVHIQAGLEAMRAHVPQLRGARFFDGAGHWLQQEAPDLVNEELIAFLRGL
jgi:pimeloyl-ACP methyl ester carboxylesterase